MIVRAKKENVEIRSSLIPRLVGIFEIHRNRQCTRDGKGEREIPQPQTKPIILFLIVILNGQTR